jgi:hypothetical protein
LNLFGTVRPLSQALVRGKEAFQIAVFKLRRY